MAVDGRLQKLLSTEYEDFNELVLLESPFAETTRDGVGIVQLLIGLTRSKLILAIQYPSVTPAGLSSQSGLDPELEGLELESLTPIEIVNLTVFRRKSRNTIKAHFINGVIRYFELAAPSSRQKYWSDWLGRLKSLTPEAVSSTQSETSVGTSTSSLSLFGPTRINVPEQIAWPVRDVYLGKRFGMGEPKRRITLPSGSHHIPREIETEITPLNRRREGSTVCQVNRFGEGIDERCATSLFLPSQLTVFSMTYQTYECMNKEDSDREWEPPVLPARPLHPRKYGLVTLPHFMFGLGLWPLTTSEASLTQIRKCCSSTLLRSGKNVNDLPLDISKRLLISCISCENVHRFEKQQMPWLLFWTPGYWSQPRFVRFSYSKLRNHLKILKHYQEIPDSNKRRKWLSKYYKSNNGTKKRKQVDCQGGVEESIFKQNIQNSLKIDIPLTSWDFDSTLIAHQMTLLDRELLLKIPVNELIILMKERNSSNTPNIRTMIAFSNRLVNLISTEVVKINQLKMRARLIARWINVADKLNRLQNQQGTRNVLLALQSPGVYRLSQTWTSVRKHHNTKYRRLLTLLRMNTDVRSERYAKMMSQVTRSPPYLPSLEYILAILLGWASPSPAVGHSICEATLDRLLGIWSTAAQSFGLTATPLVKEFLTKTRYLEEMENFKLASKLEPNISRK